MPGFSDAKNLEIDSAGSLDGSFVLSSGLRKIFPCHVSLRDVYVLGLNVDVVEKILPHEPVVAVDAVRTHRIVFVEVERHDVGEVESFLPVHPYQLAVDAD